MGTDKEASMNKIMIKRVPVIVKNTNLVKNLSQSLKEMDL